MMSNEGFLLRRLVDIGKKPVLRCDQNADIREAVRLMNEADVSSIVACDGRVATGIVTNRDLRRRFEEIAVAGKVMTVREIMTAPLLTLPPSARIYDALALMVSRRIHHVVVVDIDGAPLAMLSDTEVRAAHADSPFLFGRVVDAASTVEDLRSINKRIPAVVSAVFTSGLEVQVVTRLVTSFYDIFTAKVLDILAGEQVPELVGKFSFMVAGSEGRKEQTLKTDQDNLIAYSDDLTPAEVEKLGQFAVNLVEKLVYIGVPPCPGNMMASNPLWRKSEKEWVSTVENWIMHASPETVTNFGMLCDFRSIWGPPEFERSIKAQIHRSIDRNPIFLSIVARNILRFPPPLDFFNRMKTEGKGDHEGRIDLKKAGIFALTEGLTLFGLEVGFLEGSTFEKIGKLAAAGVINRSSAERYIDAFSFLFNLRLRHQIEMQEKGLAPDNFIDPENLSLTEMAGLKETLKTIKFFQSYLREKFKVDMISL